MPETPALKTHEAVPMDYEKIAAVNGATTAYAAAVQAYIAAEEFWIKM